jgi:NAD-dependent SIR2 family protein deacetylase
MVFLTLDQNPDGAIQNLQVFVEGRRRLVVLTGAGCSTESGIPDYRDRKGNWKRKMPVRFGEFLRSELVQKRYWARSLTGWRTIAQARPNRAHYALAKLEEIGLVFDLITQNVDGLHQKAGSRKVIDLHGRLDTVVCLDCGGILRREEFQHELESRNPTWTPEAAAEIAPDGDIDLETDFSQFVVPGCPTCGGILKPNVVFFGETVPRQVVRWAEEKIRKCDALLVVGSSLMVWSGYRLVRLAIELDIPLAVVNLGKTRADNDLGLKVSGKCGAVLSLLTERILAAC